MPTNPLCSLAYFKDLRGVTSDAKDSYYWRLLRAVSDNVESYVGRQLRKGTVTEFPDTNGTRQLPLRVTPVHSVTSVYLDFEGHFGQGASDPFGATTLLTVGQDYVLQLDHTGVSHSGILVKIDGVWPERNRVHEVGRVSSDLISPLGNVKVTYTGGYDPIPEDLQYACAQLAGYMDRTLPYGQNLVMERLEHYFYKADSAQHESALLGSVRQILSRYRQKTFW